MPAPLCLGSPVGTPAPARLSHRADRSAPRSAPWTPRDSSAVPESACMFKAVSHGTGVPRVGSVRREQLPRYLISHVQPQNAQLPSCHPAVSPYTRAYLSQGRHRCWKWSPHCRSTTERTPCLPGALSESTVWAVGLWALSVFFLIPVKYEL